MTPIYKYMYRGLMSYAIRILGEEIKYVAEDCVQDAIMKTYENLDAFETSAHWRSYMLTCLRNSALMMLRKKDAKSNYLATLEKKDFETDLMVTSIRQETLDTLFAAIDSLPDIYREIFNLSFEQGLKNKDVARLLNIAEGTFNKRKSNLILRLRSIMGISEEELMSLITLAVTVNP